MNMPIPFDIVNLINSSFAPQGVDVHHSAAYNFYCRYLYDKMLAVFTFKLPKTFGDPLFKNALFANGYVTVLPTDKYGLTAQWGCAGGYTVNYDPRYIIFANPLLPELSGRELVIDEDCAVIRMSEDWHGVIDLVAYYARRLALVAQSAEVNAINTKISYIIAAKDKNQATSFKKMLDRINDGQPAVVIDKTLIPEDGDRMPWTLLQQQPKQVYLLHDLLNDLAEIEDEFNTRIGIPNANTDKRERLITDEVNANNVETAILAAAWLEHIKAGCERVKEMYGADIKVDWRYKPDVSAISADNTKQGNNRNSRPSDINR